MSDEVVVIEKEKVRILTRGIQGPPGVSGAVTDGDKGDIVVSGGGSVWTVEDNAITNAKAADMVTKTYKGRTSVGTGDPEDVPVATLKTDLALTKSDVGLGNVDNTSDVNKPISTAQQAALDLKAPLASPGLTGVPTAPTATLGTNTTQIATTAFIQNAIAPFAPLASPGFTGVPTAPTAAPGTNTTQIASTAFVRTEVANAVTGLLEFIGNIDCSGNPNYPAANKGDLYYVSVAGKIGGASGISVDVGDAIVAKADNAGGTQAAVGSSWFILEHNLQGALLAANNLSDVANAGTARSNLGLAIGSNVQAWDADLDAIAALTTATYGRSLLTLADAAALTAQVNTFTNVLKGAVPASGGGTANFLRADGTWAASIPDGDKGDVTVSSSGATFTIDNDVVTYAKLQNISATNRFLGRITAAAGDAEELTGTQATTLLDTFTSALKGLAPASGGGTANFLRADGSWVSPPSLAIGTTVGSSTIGSVLFVGASNALSEDNANLFWDDTNNKLGIGINASLAGQLHVKGASGVPALVLQPTTQYDVFLHFKDQTGTTRVQCYLDGNNSPAFIGPPTWSFNDGSNLYFQVRGNDYSNTASSVMIRSVVAGKPCLDLYPTAAQSANILQVTSNDGAGTAGDIFSISAGGNQTQKGKTNNYNNIATVGNGVPAEYAQVNLTAQGAAIGATTLYAVPATGAGMYRVSFVAKVTRAATTSSTLGGAGGFQAIYTDQDDSVVVTTGLVTNISGATLTGNTTQIVYAGSIVVNAKASTNIQYQFGYTSSGATTMQYNMHVRVEAL